MVEITPHCVITGSSSGIGATLAHRLLDAGWLVTGIDRDPLPDALAARMQAIRVDLADAAAVEALDFTAQAGPVTAFVHCAGIMRTDTDASARRDLGSDLWRLHVGSAEQMVRRLAPAMPDKEGRIVLVSSRAAQGRAGRALYSASKSALDGLVRSFAAELIGRGITANVVAPGSTATPMLQDPARANARVMPLPIGRLIDPEEIAALIEFLLGKQAGAITAQTIFICGGASIAGV